MQIFGKNYCKKTDIICPYEGQTEVYVHSRNCKDLKADSDFIERSLIVLLDFLEDKIQQNTLKFIQFEEPIRRKKSDFTVKLNLTIKTQQRFDSLYQGWIIA